MLLVEFIFGTFLRPKSATTSIFNYNLTLKLTTSRKKLLSNFAKKTPSWMFDRSQVTPHLYHTVLLFY